MKSIAEDRLNTTLSEMRLPTRSVSTAEFELNQQIPIWQAYNAPLVKFEALDDDTPGLNATVTIWQKQALLMVNLTCARPQARRYSVSLSPAEQEFQILRFGRSGRMAGRIGENPVDFLPGDVHLFDIRHTFQAISDGVDQISLYVPYQDIGFDPSRDPPHLVFRAGTPANQLIKSAINAICDQLPDKGVSDASAMIIGLCGMLKGMLSSARPPEGSQEALERLRAKPIRRFILEHLTNPDLNIQMLIERFGASRATIYRAFEDSGDLARFISDHRLERAKWDLMTGDGKRGLIRYIAEKYGFHDTGNFNRAFRWKFNAPPLELMHDVITSTAGNSSHTTKIDAAAREILRLSDLLHA